MAVRDAPLAEAARRLLKCENGRLIVPIEIIHTTQKLALKISDELPSMVHEPKVELGAEDDLVTLKKEEQELVRLGGGEPSNDTVWVPVKKNEIEQVWLEFTTIVSDLLSAGYPGCIDCAGPAATEPWDEISSRTRLRDSA
ncbi:MAG: hypothetical protein H8D82_00710 [Euryarchaeota archaeon]|nr:hypothetical protein [Euryarchaeota archaeon]